VLVLSLFLAGCSSTPPVRTDWSDTARTLGIRGSIYLLAGPNEPTMDVYRWDGGTATPHRLTTSPQGQGVDYLTAAAGTVVIDAALPDSGFLTGGHFLTYDFSQGKFTALGLHVPDHSGTPELSLDGRSLAYTESRPDLQQRQWVGVLHVVDLDTMKDRDVYSVPTLDVSPIRGWSSDGMICFLQDVRSGGKTVKALAPDGNVRTLVTYIETVSGIARSSNGLLAVGERKQADMVVYDQQGRQLAALAGWAPLTWSPDGSQLLLASATPTLHSDDQRSGAGRELAVVNRADLSHPQLLGRLPEPVWEGAWLQ